MGDLKSIGEVLNKRLNMTLLRKDKCKNCKQPLEVYEASLAGGPDKGKKIEIAYGCICEDMKLANRAKEARRRAEQNKREEIFDRYSLVSRDLQTVTLEGYEPSNESQTYAKAKTIEYIESFDPENPWNLAFFGPYGVGKSHLSKVIADKVLERGYSSIFVTVPKLLRKIRSTYNKNAEFSEEDIYNHLESVDLLVLDDYGVEKASDWAEERLYDVVNSREGLHTIITTNDTPDELLERIGERDFSRLIKSPEWIVEVEGANYRMRAFDIKGEA